jgi:hypothetical protein
MTEIEELRAELAKHKALLENHGEQLHNLYNMMNAVTHLLSTLQAAQQGHQKVFEALQTAVAEKLGMLPPDEPPAVN